jgi:tetratricopeptide (TPR) repeat protein
LAVVQHGGKGRVPGTAVRNLEKALQLGLSDVHQQAVAHYLLAQFQLDKGQGQAALDHLAQAFSTAEGQPETSFNPLFKAKLYQLRSLAYQRLRQPELAHEAAQQAVTLAQETGNEPAVAYYQGKLKQIEEWNGRRS